jgi:hypothetical protein
VINYVDISKDIFYVPKHGNVRAAPGRLSAYRGELARTTSKMEVKK